MSTQFGCVLINGHDTQMALIYLGSHAVTVRVVFFLSFMDGLCS